MKSTMIRRGNRLKLSAKLSLVLGVLALVVGCDQKPTTEFITTSNGLIYRANRSTGEVVLVGGKPDVAELIPGSNGLLYRLNKQSGELCLVVGGQLTKLDEPGIKKADEIKKSYLKYWPSESLTHFADTQFNVVASQSQTNETTFRIRTTWRDGRLYYIAAISAYPPKIKKERDRSGSEAQFNVTFTDEDGFDLFALPLKVSEMSGVVNEYDEITSLSAKGSVTCTLDTYEGLKLMTLGWRGFPRE